ncbi:MAG: SMP-30/gluconolactonase/LRE family protein [Verrucomicrobia bacterium]|nr:SMP-30/gluconolactonase/LRE family protein [Verrucomicrobiota bacterium]
MNRITVVLCLGWLLALGAQELSAQSVVRAETANGRPPYPTFGRIERLDRRLNQLLAPDARLEKLAEGFQWAEGPIWVPNLQGLLFSDVKGNTIYEWKAGQGIRVFLRPSGYTGSTPRDGEPGSNGLTLDRAGRLVLCEHGDRRISRLGATGRKRTLAEYYKYRRFNSPNDLVYKSSGDLYFTDPPYGLLGTNHEVGKELLFSGVYRLKPDGELNLLTDALTFPNGLAFSPDEKKFYVAVSDPARAVWMVYDVRPDGTIDHGRIFYDAASLTKDRPGLPDGMKVDLNGNLFAAGPGGILVFSPDGTHLGTIITGEPTANCNWGDDGSTLYIAANHYLARIKTNTRGKLH